MSGIPGLPLSLQVGEIDAVDVLHDEISRPVVVEGEVVDRADVRVLEPDRGLRLLEEAPLHLRVRDHVRLHDLDDADLVEKAVADAVDRPHAAFADLAEDLVLAFEEKFGLLHRPRLRIEAFDCRTEIADNRPRWRP